MLPALALTTPFGVGLIEFAMLLAALYYMKSLWQQRVSLFHSAWLVVAAFVLHFVLAAFSLAWSGFSLRALDNPSRQALALAAIGVIVLTRPKAELFWHGVFVGTVGAFGLALYERFVQDLPRAEGFHMPIMFGNLAIAMGLMSLAAVPRFANSRFAILPYMAFVASVGASLLSGTRGSWIALLLAFVPFFAYRRQSMGRSVIALAIASFALFMAASVIPELKVRERVQDASAEVTEYYQAGKADTSVGARLEMWKGAWIMFAEQPLLGVGRANFNNQMNALIARGDIDPAISQFRHAHNEMLHVMATGGLVGALALMFLYAAPIVFFIRVFRRIEIAKPYALAGLLLVLSYVGFGLTQVMFTHHIGNLFYALTICVLVGICVMLQQSKQSDSAA